MYLATKLCCLCVKNDKITMNINNVDLDNIKIMDKLIFCIPELTYNISNHLVYICSICHDNLNLLYYFKNTCMKNYKQFLDFITEMENSNINESVFRDLTISVPESSNPQPNNYSENDTEIIPQNNCISEIRPVKEENNDYNLTEDEKVIIDIQTEEETEESNCLTDQQSSNSVTTVINDNEKPNGTKDVTKKSSALTRLSVSGKMLSCAICQRQFSRKGNLDVHQRLHTGERPFSCSICHKHFPHKNTLNVHLRTHTGEKPYACTFCNKRFGYKCNLNNHVRIHTGERPYSCALCQKSFRSKNNLRSHKRVHSKAKGITCSICKKKFFNANDLNSHLAIHSNVKKLDH